MRRSPPIPCGSLRETRRVRSPSHATRAADDLRASAARMRPCCSRSPTALANLDEPCAYLPGAQVSVATCGAARLLGVREQRFRLVEPAAERAERATEGSLGLGGRPVVGAQAGPTDGERLTHAGSAPRASCIAGASERHDRSFR